MIETQMDGRRWVFKLFLFLFIVKFAQSQSVEKCVGFNSAKLNEPNLVDIGNLDLINQDSSYPNAIWTKFVPPNVCCFNYTETKCYDSSTYRLAAPRSDACNIQGINKWNATEAHFKIFGIRALLNGNKSIAFVVGFCKIVKLSNTTTPNPVTTVAQTTSAMNTPTDNAPTTFHPTTASTLRATTGGMNNSGTETHKNLKPNLIEESLDLNPASAENLLRVESLLYDVARNITEAQKINEDYGLSQLYIEFVKQNQMKYNSNLMLGSAHIDFALQTNGVKQFVVAVFVFKINTTQTAQTQPVEAGSLSATRYMATLNTTYIAIAGWDTRGFQRTGRSGPTAVDEENDQLPGNASILAPLNSPEAVCNKLKVEMETTSNLIINKLEPICLFFDRVEKQYSDRGCITSVGDTTGNITCKCNHLTLFTVLLAVQFTTIPKGVKVTSYTTESASIMFLVATIIILFKSKHSGDRVPVQINLSLALLLFHAVNVSHDLAVMHEISCVMLTAASHYLLLCAGMWFLVEGIRLLMATSFPFDFQTQDSSKRLKIFMLIGWIIPAFIAGLSMSVGFPLGIYMKSQPMYEQCNEFLPILKYDRCWLAPGTPIFYATVVAPLALVLLINFMIVLKTTHVMLHSKRMRKRGEDPGTADTLRAAKSFILLFLMLGGTWVFAFFTGMGNDISKEVFMYIHSLVNGLQGIVVFLLYCVMDDDIRQGMMAYKRKKAGIASEQQGSEANAQAAESSIH